MVIFHNKTPYDVLIVDHYPMDLQLNSGYYGATEKGIPAGRKTRIRSSIYERQMEEERKPQQIHLRIGEETKLILHHVDLSKNKHIFLEMHEGSIIPRYSPKTGTSFAGRIWGIFPFCGSGF